MAGEATAGEVVACAMGLAAVLALAVAEEAAEVAHGQLQVRQREDKRVGGRGRLLKGKQ